MVFSALPVYLDPPNWQQQNDQQGTGSENHPQLLPRHPAPPPTHGGGSVRPGSTSDRARLAKIQPPETYLKCPRCGSTNTKFCYYNNYSLSQPRHFCKACRRYWTRGGNIRNVPVGGGCRKNKKNKTNSSKSSTSTEKQVAVAVTHESDQITAHFPQQSPHLPFMASLQNLSQYGLGNIGLNFGGIHGQISGASGHTDHMGFQQQLSFFEQSNNLYPFQSEGSIDASSSSRVSQLAPLMKTENNVQRLNLSRTQLGDAENNQYWGGNSTWTDLSGLNSSTANHLL